MVGALILPFLHELNGHAELSQTALILPENLKEADWERVGYGLAKVDQSTQWWIGDWWAFGSKMGCSNV